MRLRKALAFLPQVLSFICIVAGVSLWSIPAGLVTAGVLLLIDSLT